MWFLGLSSASPSLESPLGSSISRSPSAQSSLSEKKFSKLRARFLIIRIYHSEQAMNGMKKNSLIAMVSMAVMAVATMSCSKEAYFYDAFYPGDVNYMEGEGELEPEPGDNFYEIKENAFILTAEQPVSSFSVDADGATYAYMRRCLRDMKTLPQPNAVRIEEYLNYFTFSKPLCVSVNS
jgi:hypothetical protein